MFRTPSLYRCPKGWSLCLTEAQFASLHAEWPSAERRALRLPVASQQRRTRVSVDQTPCHGRCQRPAHRLSEPVGDCGPALLSATTRINKGALPDRRSGQSLAGRAAGGDGIFRVACSAGGGCAPAGPVNEGEVSTVQQGCTRSRRWQQLGACSGRSGRHAPGSRPLTRRSLPPTLCAPRSRRVWLLVQHYMPIFRWVPLYKVSTQPRWCLLITQPRPDGLRRCLL